MMQFGSETTIYADDGKAVEITENIKDYRVFSTFKRVIVRTKVTNPREVTRLYDDFVAQVLRMHREHRLLVKHSDVSSRPSFSLEFPTSNIDDSFFVIVTYTEVVM